MVQCDVTIMRVGDGHSFPVWAESTGSHCTVGVKLVLAFCALGVLVAVIVDSV